MHIEIEREIHDMTLKTIVLGRLLAEEWLGGSLVPTGTSKSIIIEALRALQERDGFKTVDRPSERHAALAVNLAGSMAMFLIDTWAVQQAKARAKAAKEQADAKQDPVTYKGVLLSSRYHLASEIAEMKRMVDALTPDMARRLETIWCDSKACATYSVTVRDDLWVPDLQWAIADAGRKVGGHNGVYFDGDAPTDVDLDPDWPGDEALFREM